MQHILVCRLPGKIGTRSPHLCIHPWPWVLFPALNMSFNKLNALRKSVTTLVPVASPSSSVIVQDALGIFVLQSESYLFPSGRHLLFLKKFKRTNHSLGIRVIGQGVRLFPHTQLTSVQSPAHPNCP